MKILAIKDDDGHFFLAKIGNRPKVLKLLEIISSGNDYIEDCISGMTTEHQILWKHNSDISDELWEKLLWYFIQRGTIEMVEL